MHGERPKDQGVIVVYDYRSATGELLYQVVRKTQKAFQQRRPDGSGGWIWNMRGVQRVPYRLPELLRAAPHAPVFVCEGEKDCDALHERGLIATTNPGGAGKWQDSMSGYLRGRVVVILPDNDQAGADHAADVARKLHGIARSVSIIRLPDLPLKGGDVSDWLQAGGTAEDLEKLLAAAKTQEPAPAHKASGQAGPYRVNGDATSADADDAAGKSRKDGDNPAHTIIRNFFGSMTRKLSVTSSQYVGQFLGTSSRRKFSIAMLNSLNVA